MLMLLGAILLGASCSKKNEEPTGAAPAAPASARTQNVPNKAPAKCEPGADGKCQASATCSPQCQRISTPECVECERGGDCEPLIDNCTKDTLSPEEQQICFDVLSCVQTTNCFDGDATLGRCYCGKLPLEQCLQAPFSGPGAPDGVCRDVYLKGMPKATAHSHVLGLLTARVNPTSWALSRLQCQKVNRQGKCAEPCGLSAGSPAFPVAGKAQ
jgi:hypothetical protein